MNVLLISQCSKRALAETRRILDQFAERCGERSWQTPITQEGLDTLRRLLRKTARKNTAVACHWIRGRDHSELLWIVGDASQFNAEGAVPTHRTSRDVLRRHDENDWHSAEDIRLLAIMAALFHDFGKACSAFQEKLKPTPPRADAYRHEWVSLRLFEAFVGQGDDEDWLRRLSEQNTDEHLDRLQRDDQPGVVGPFKKGRMPPLAQAVGWLILSHHRLPASPKGESISLTAYHYLPSPIVASWSGARLDATAKEKSACWHFPSGLPFSSGDWRKRAAECASAIMVRANSILHSKALLSDPYVMHLARLALMLADHHYSSLPASSRYGDPAFPLYANTDRQTGQLKQRLDEHLIGVAVHARKLMGVLPRLEQQLPRIARHKGFKRRATRTQFRWQDKAYDLAISMQARAQHQGFFGVNMASTGCGKTLANGRIMYGLADPQRGARFSLALGLRTLTLQTGSAYRERLGLGEDDMAVMVGGQAVRQLYELSQQDREKDAAYGSESAESLLPDNSHVYFEGSLEQGPLKEWLGRNPSAARLINAPVLACTIDHLMPATESVRGGHQIAPMLRLLTSDLVLDEPDDFDMDDLPALSRLVHWAGLLGSKVLLSSATLPPALVQGLFAAYRAGRTVFQQHRGVPGQALNICCAWFDEFRSIGSEHADADSFALAHADFVAQRLASLKTLSSRRSAELRDIDPRSQEHDAICRKLAEQLPHWMIELHANNRVAIPGSDKHVSFGLVRMAHIDPLIDTARALCAQGAPEGYRIHLCVYHSRFPLMARSAIESQLDRLLQRTHAKNIVTDEVVRHALASSPEDNHLFVVLASPVAEVGRDHDYDWAIVEPSSMRSLIQLAGRVRRHRPEPWSATNILVLNRNIKALKGERLAYFKPGFEADKYPLAHHDLVHLLDEAQLRAIDAAPRIVEASPLRPTTSLVDLEHRRLRASLLADRPMSGEVPITYGWQTPTHLCGELQNGQRFRSGEPTERYVLLPDADDDALHFHKDDGAWRPQGNLLEQIQLMIGPRIDCWGCSDPLAELLDLAKRLDEEPRRCAERFAGVDLRQNTNGWLYHPALGFRSNT